MSKEGQCDFCWHPYHGAYTVKINGDPASGEPFIAGNMAEVRCAATREDSRPCWCDGQTQWVSFYVDTQEWAESIADEVGRIGYDLFVWGEDERVRQVPEGEVASLAGKFCVTGYTYTSPAKSRGEHDERRREIARKAGVEVFI